MPRLLLAAGLLLGPGCVRDGVYVCGSDEQCNFRPEGRCEPNDRCSYPDSDCASGYSYGRFAGELAGVCVDVPVADGSTSGATAPATPPTTTSSTSPPTSTDTGSDAESEGSGSTGGFSCGEPEPSPLCDGVDCSGLGECVEVDGEATCWCNPGTYPDEGLVCRTDPCEACAPDCADNRLCVYFDDECGPGATGTRTDPMCLITDLQDELDANRGPGPTYLLLRRGAEWTVNADLEISTTGSQDTRLVVGAWDDGERPLLRGARVHMENASYVTVRDLEIDGATGDRNGCVFAHPTSTFITVAGTLLHDCGDPLDKAPAPAVDVRSANTVIIDNEIGPNATRGIVVAGGGQTPKHAYFVVDNRIEGIGDQGIRLGESGVDVKVLGNHVADALCDGIINLADTAWVVGNVVAKAGRGGCGQYDAALHLHSDGEDVQVSGNLVFDSTEAVRVWGSARLFNNTVVHEAKTAGGGAEAIAFEQNAKGGSVRDSLIRTDGGGLTMLYVSETAKLGVDSDQNTFDPSGFACSFRAAAVVHDSLEAWQSLGYDPSSICVDVPGFDEVPDWDTVDDWTDDFLAALRPSEDFGDCCPAPGAYDCDGVPQGRTIEPLPEANNEGVGWAGPLSVRQRYP